MVKKQNSLIDLGVLEKVILAIENELSNYNIEERQLIIKILSQRINKQAQDQRIGDILGQNPVIKAATKLAGGFLKQ